MTKQLFSTEELALLDAIHDDPRNDRPRLAYADWLETHGLPGIAEFIRIQCREPYFILEMGADPRVDIETYWIKHDDPARANRAIELLRPLYNSDRFPKTYLFEQVIRGLPRYEDEQNDAGLGKSVDALYPELSPLARFNIALRTAHLAEWMAHPLMRFIDGLKILPEGDPDDPFDPDEDSLSPEFTAKDILVLEQFPFLDQLQLLQLCADAPDDVRQLARQRIEPRVTVEYNASFG